MKLSHGLPDTVEKLEENLEEEVGYGDFFRNAPEQNPCKTLIK